MAEGPSSDALQRHTSCKQLHFPAPSLTTARQILRPSTLRPRQSCSRPSLKKSVSSLLILTSSAMAQNCISLEGSSACPAFSSASVSTGTSITNLFPFMQNVSSREQFDNDLKTYVASSYAQQKYQQLIGCSSVNLDNTTDLYARYTNSVICNAIVQNSIGLCDSSRDPEPLCADSCAEYAISEQEISASSDLCGSAGPNALSQIRADFTNCALPARSLSGGTCISAVDNEPNDCGYGSNLSGLCGFCGTSSPNATDSCCVNANAESRCQNVDLPSFTSLEPLFTTTTIAQPTSSASTAPVASDDGTLSAGQIAGIVVGSVLGALLLMALIIFGCVLLRRRKSNPPSSIFNQPSPARRGSSREKPFGDGARPEMVPGRVARMAALEDGSTSSRPRSDAPSSERGFKSGSPDRHRIVAAGGLPRRNGSLSSQSALNLGEDPNSPQTSSGFGDQFSSPDAVTSGQSEQLAFFKDYYSQDEIHPHDTVATLWAYQPRANDEFELERGDMLKVVGIWDDGWATGVKVTERAEAWERRRQEQRDSGVSNGGGPSPVPATGEIKAFPLVCVCLPQHWRKTIDGDTTGEAPDPHGGNVPPRTSTPP